MFCSSFLPWKIYQLGRSKWLLSDYINNYSTRSLSHNLFVRIDHIHDDAARILHCLSYIFFHVKRRGTRIHWLIKEPCMLFWKLLQLSLFFHCYSTVLNNTQHLPCLLFYSGLAFIFSDQWKRTSGLGEQSTGICLDWWHGLALLHISNIWKGICTKASVMFYMDWVSLI